MVWLPSLVSSLGFKCLEVTISDFIVADIPVISSTKVFSFIVTMKICRIKPSQKIQVYSVNKTTVSRYMTKERCQPFEETGHGQYCAKGRV